jgi:4-amino-4-deoxy-L-arabinose transferase-like glycosyltransferase
MRAGVARADVTVASVPKRRDLPLIAAYAAILVWLAGLRPLWLDEVLQLVASTQPDARSVIRWVTYNPGGAPLGYLAQRVFVLGLGMTPLAARAAPAIFSLLSAIALAGFARDLKAGATTLVLAAFLVTPLQLRYAVEGRPYSQALFLALAALWCLWRLVQLPSRRLAAAYAALVTAGLYTQPLTAAVQLGALAALAGDGRRRAVRLGGIALAIACLLFVPWYLHVRSAWHFGIAASHYSFAMAPKIAWMMLREISGGGYVASLSLIGAAALGWRRADPLARRLLLGSVISGIVCAIAADAISGYFFAVRQVLFVLPAVLLLATAGLPRPRREWWQRGLLAIFLVASLAKDARYFRSPGEDWPGAARALLAATSHGACAVVPSPEPKEMYQIFEPGLSGRFCNASDAAGPVAIVQNRYTLASSLEETIRALAARGYRAAGETDVSGVRLRLFLPGYEGVLTQ